MYVCHGFKGTRPVIVWWSKATMPKVWEEAEKIAKDHGCDSVTVKSIPGTEEKRARHPKNPENPETPVAPVAATSPA